MENRKKKLKSACWEKTHFFLSVNVNEFFLKMIDCPLEYFIIQNPIWFTKN